MGDFTNKWWIFVVRGVLAILLGLLSLFVPGISLIVLVGFVAAFWLLDGVFSLFAVERAAQTGRPWGWLAFEGIAGVLAAVLTWFYPQITALALVLIIGAWAVVTGIFKVATAFRLRQVMEHEWLLGASGAISIAFGVLLFARPGAGLLAVIWLIGIFAVVFGGLLFGAGIRLHGFTSPRTQPPVPV